MRALKMQTGLDVFECRPDSLGWQRWPGHRVQQGPSQLKTITAAHSFSVVPLVIT